jgi:hypothetical protein
MNAFHVFRKSITLSGPRTILSLLSLIIMHASTIPGPSEPRPRPMTLTILPISYSKPPDPGFMPNNALATCDRQGTSRICLEQPHHSCTSPHWHSVFSTCMYLAISSFTIACVVESIAAPDSVRLVGDGIPIVSLSSNILSGRFVRLAADASMIPTSGLASALRASDMTYYIA